MGCERRFWWVPPEWGHTQSRIWAFYVQIWFSRVFRALVDGFKAGFGEGVDVKRASVYSGSESKFL
jgi:hypothetical protein